MTQQCTGEKWCLVRNGHMPEKSVNKPSIDINTNACTFTCNKPFMYLFLSVKFISFHF